MTAPKPREGRCVRCKQPRPVFVYKPLHDCINDIGHVDLVDAATHLAWIEENGDQWCQARIDRMPRRLCVPCHDKEAVEEQEFITEYLDES